MSRPQGKGIGTPENKERAFEVFREFGGKTHEQALAALAKRHGLRISRQTLDKWATEGDWAGRIERADNLASGRTAEGGKVKPYLKGMLLDRARAYDTYFQSLDLSGKVPPFMDMFAFASVVGSLLKLDAKFDEAQKLGAIEDAETSRKKAKEVMKQYYGIDIE